MGFIVGISQWIQISGLAMWDFNVGPGIRGIIIREIYNVGPPR